MDEFHGQGGSYVVDKDGKRRLVHRTAEPQVQSEAPAPAAAEAEPVPAEKGE